MNKTKTITTIALALLLTISALIAIAPIPNTIEAQDDYGDLLQYEWMQMGATSSLTYSSEGPAPDSPEILWKITIPGLVRGGQPGDLQSFNGKVFVFNSTHAFALDAFTGNTVWAVQVPAFSPYGGIGVVKLDDTRMMIGRTCLEIETGNILWTSPVALGYSSFYSREEKMIFEGSGRAWDLSDLSQPPISAWNLTDQLEKEAIDVYGDGMVFTKRFTFIHAINATTGEIIWETPTTAYASYSMCYYMGRIFSGQLDGNFVCWNATTGELLWTFHPDTPWAFWAGRIAAYNGKVYSLNQDAHLYALDAKTGKMVWKYKGPGVFYHGHAIVGGGKVYAQTGDDIYTDPNTHEPGKNEYACLDAETGKLIWTLPIGVNAPNGPHSIAYGNLYIIPAFKTTLQIGGGIITRPATGDEVWCISNTPIDWSMWRSDPANSAHGTGPTNLALRWKFKTGAAVSSSPSIVDGVVYVGSHDKNIYAIDADTGSKIWTFATGYQVKSSPAVVDGKVYTGADDGNIYCLDAEDGTQLWETYAGGFIDYSSFSWATIRSSPAVVGNRVYVGSLDKNLYCLDANSGNIIWTYSTPTPICSSPAVVNGAVYIPSTTPRPNGTLVKLDANDGSVIWQVGIPYGGYFPATVTSPTVADDMVFLPADAYDHYCINATTGAIKWKWTGTSWQPNFASMVYADGLVYTQNMFDLIALNVTTGNVAWRAFLAREIYGAPTYSFGRIYAPNEQGALYVLDAKTGEKLSYYETGSQHWSSPSLYNSRVYIGGFDNNVYCFEQADLGLTSYPPPDPTPTPTPTPTSTPTPTPTPPEPTPAPLTDVYIAGSTIAIIAAIGIATFLLLRRKK